MTAIVIVMLCCVSHCFHATLYCLLVCNSFRIASNLTLEPFLSAEEIVSCLKTTQGCDGGYPYLVAKSGHEHGFVLNSEFVYSVC
jgi:hypothetical protein